jgi:hypothetical protein
VSDLWAADDLPEKSISRAMPFSGDLLVASVIYLWPLCFIQLSVLRFPPKQLSCVSIPDFSHKALIFM